MESAIIANTEYITDQVIFENMLSLKNMNE